MKNKTLTKNMPNVKWNLLPPRRGPNPQGVKNGIQTSNKQVVNGKEVTKKTFK